MRLDALDGLRGLAIAMVVWFHIWQLSWLPPRLSLFGNTLNFEYIPVTGFLGVELFFFVSGFCLYYPLARHVLEGAVLPRLSHYVYRRFIKIVPSYYLCILLILLFFPCFPLWRDTLWHAGTHLLFVHNLFPETYGSINGVFWSLGVEVQFYVIFPVIAWQFRRRPLLTYLALVCSAMLYRHSIPLWGHEHWGFWLNQLPGVVDLFAGGMLAAHLLVALRNQEFVQRWKPLWTAIAIACGALFILLLQGLYEIRYEPDVFTIWPTKMRFALSLLFMGVAVFSLLANSFWQRLLGNPLLVFLSTLSYNLYLWHQFVARVLFERRILRFLGTDPHLDPQWQVAYSVLALVVSLAVASAFTYLWERPLLRYGIRGCLGRLVPKKRGVVSHPS